MMLSWQQREGVSNLGPRRQRRLAVQASQLACRHRLCAHKVQPLPPSCPGFLGQRVRKLSRRLRHVFPCSCHRTSLFGDARARASLLQSATDQRMLALAVEGGGHVLERANPRFPEHYCTPGGRWSGSSSPRAALRYCALCPALGALGARVHREIERSSLLDPPRR